MKQLQWLQSAQSCSQIIKTAPSNEQKNSVMAIQPHLYWGSDTSQTFTSVQQRVQWTLDSTWYEGAVRQTRWETATFQCTYSLLRTRCVWTSLGDMWDKGCWDWTPPRCNTGRRCCMFSPGKQRQQITEERISWVFLSLWNKLPFIASDMLFGGHLSRNVTLTYFSELHCVYVKQKAGEQGRFCSNIWFDENKANYFLFLRRPHTFSKT